MGTTKSALFTVQQNEIASVMKALGHPARIAIIQYLVKANHCINSSLVEELGLAQATISQHLKELKSVGLIKGTVEGNSINYCIDEEKWAEAKAELIHFFDSYQAFSAECC